MSTIKKQAQSCVLSLWAILLCVAIPPVIATPVLLAELQAASTYGSSREPFTEITAVSFGLVYGDPNTLLLNPCVGCELIIPVGQTGVFTLDASTSPAGPM